MSCRPHVQRHSSTTTSLPEPPLRIPRATGRPLASTCHHPETLETAPRPPRAAPPRHHPCTVAHLRHRPAGTSKGRRTPASLPHTVALRGHPELRTPRDRHTKEKLGPHIPSPLRPRDRCPGILFFGQPSAPKMLTSLPCRLPAVGGTTPTPPTPPWRPRAAALASLSEAGLHTPKSSASRSWRTPTRPPRWAPRRGRPPPEQPRPPQRRRAATTATPRPEPAGSLPQAPTATATAPHEPVLHRAPRNSLTTFGSGVPPPPRRRPPAAAAGEAQAERVLGDPPNPLRAPNL
nr:uncharacterized protein LOC127316292 [Lolium perenne]